MSAQKFQVYLVSDSTGDTVVSFARAVLAQFAVLPIVEKLHNLITTQVQLDQLLLEIKAQPGPVIFTFSNKQHRAQLRALCQELAVPCIAILSDAINELSEFFQVKNSPRATYPMDYSYFSRIEALEYSLNHDDGQAIHNLNQADIILIGVSRTSKTPTSVYLALKGYKTGNIPLVPGTDITDKIKSLTKPLLIGLTITRTRLMEIRRNRILSLTGSDATDYTDQTQVNQEIRQALEFFREHNIVCLDMTHRSIEEAAAKIIQIYKNR